MIKIIIADDHEIVLEGLASLVQPKDGIKMVGLAKNGKEVLAILHEKEVDLVVLDIEMPEMDGIETTKVIREQFPHIKILILTMYNEIGFIRKIMETGAQGYILKNKGKEELVYAIQAIYDGEEYYGKEVSKTVISSMKNTNSVGEVKLTRREIEVLKRIAQGDTTPIISERLHIAHATVETHRRNLIEKTGVRNTKMLVKFAVEHGYI
ncbi:MAG: response regulator transcription factor [Bacteroidota bacterium]